MSIEQHQHDQARSALQKILREPSLPFGPALLSGRQADAIMQAIELLIETRIALREREILAAFERMIEDQDERTRLVLATSGERVPETVELR